jgi:two-component system sensor histidine kinase BarA
MNGSERLGVDDIVLSHSFQIEELLDKSALAEMVQSLEVLISVPLRVYSVSGLLLADSQGVPAFYSLLSSTAEGRKMVGEVISQVRAQSPRVGETLVIPCVSGGSYLISAIVYEGRLLGRTILGPYLSPSLDVVPPEVLALVPPEQVEEVTQSWRALPQIPEEKAHELDRHLRASLDLLIFTGLKAHLASHMHMASVQESFRELTEGNRKLQVAYDRLKELDRLKSNFLATVSHELRTPLTSIIGYSEMIIEGIAGEINDEQREFLHTIHEKGEQLLELIKSLLDLSKLESGTMSLRRSDVDCSDLVQQVVSTMTPTARKRGIELKAETREALPALHADAGRLRQVLNNLCENAMKFTPRGGAVTIAVEEIFLAGEDLGGVGGVLMAPAQRPAIEITVRDTGVGVPPEERHRVFDAFYQVDSSSTREVGGTGLGLSIVKRLVDAHDGTIRVEGNEPNGAVFIVTLPIPRRH